MRDSIAPVVLIVIGLTWIVSGGLYDDWLFTVVGGLACFVGGWALAGVLGER